jgi:hypothetical protein
MTKLSSSGIAAIEWRGNLGDIQNGQSYLIAYIFYLLMLT